MDTHFDEHLQQEIEEIVELYSELSEKKKLVYEVIFDNDFTHWRLKLEAVKNSSEEEDNHILKIHKEVRVFV